MAVKDIKSNLLEILALVTSISDDVTVNGAIIDGADFELGFMASMSAAVYIDGTYTMVLEQSDTGEFAGEEELVPADSLIGELPVIAVATIQGDILQTVGVFSNKRFIRVSVVATDVTTGANLSSVVTQKAELLPVESV